MWNKKIKKSIEIVTVFVFFSAFLLSLSSPISDPDVFWHLKTGEWIWTNKALPEEDPFSVMEYQDRSESARFILRQYWLAQLIMHGFYQLGGFYGIILFRVLVYFAVGIILYHWMGKQGISRIGRLIFLIPMVYFSSRWFEERPNILSFLLVVAEIYFLEGLRENAACLNRSRQLHLSGVIGMPLIMLLWANMHGGFILGDVIIVLYMAGEGIRFLSVNFTKCPKNESQVTRFSLPFFAVCIVSILCSFGNPNTYKVIIRLSELATGKLSTINVFEHRSLFDYTKAEGYHLLIFVCILAASFLFRIRRLRFGPMLVLVFLALLSIYGIRYIPFFVFAATFFIAELWGISLDKIIGKIERFYLHTLPVIVCIVFLFLGFMKYSFFLKDSLFSSYYPEDTVRFIKKERPEGRIFNEFTLGGYFIWSLYPDYRVFIDGRRLSQSAEWPYQVILSGTIRKISGIPEWKVRLDEQKINAVLVPCVNIKGGVFIRLVHRLAEDKEWHLVFIDKNILLFIRDTARNRGIISRYSIPKEFAYLKALEQAEGFRSQFPDYWKGYALLGEINLYMGRPNLALSYFKSAFILNPSLGRTIFGRLVDEVRAGRDYRNLLEQTIFVSE